MPSEQDFVWDSDELKGDVFFAEVLKFDVQESTYEATVGESVLLFEVKNLSRVMSFNPSVFYSPSKSTVSKWGFFLAACKKAGINPKSIKVGVVLEVEQKEIQISRRGKPSRVLLPIRIPNASEVQTVLDAFKVKEAEYLAKAGVAAEVNTDSGGDGVSEVEYAIAEIAEELASAANGKSRKAFIREALKMDAFKDKEHPELKQYLMSGQIVDALISLQYLVEDDQGVLQAVE